MSGRRTPQRIAGFLAGRVLADAIALLPPRQREWGEAIQAEAAVIACPAERFRFMLSGALGVVRIAAAEALRGRLADPRMVAAAALLGLVAAVVDLSAGSRWPLRILLGAGSLLLGALAPRAAWRWGLLAALALPLLAELTGFPGPYAHDRGDVWFPLLPAILLALAGGALARWAGRRFAGMSRWRGNLRS